MLRRLAVSRTGDAGGAGRDMAEMLAARSKYMGSHAPVAASRKTADEPLRV